MLRRSVARVAAGWHAVFPPLFHAAALSLGHLPELGFVADRGACGVHLARVVPSLGQCLPHSIDALR
ncbi:MAG: hypothetical protein ACP5ON_10965 [Bacteroidota bacterium]